MTEPLDAATILRDIEFEIVQGVLGQDELNKAVQEVKRYQNRARHEVLESKDAAKQSREMAARQFQINDMLLTLLQEMAGRIRQLRVELQKTSGLLQHPAPGEPSPAHLATEHTSVAAESRERPTSETERFHEASPTGPAQVPRFDKGIEIEAQIRPVKVPLMGGLLTRLRAALHTLPLFYVQQLADQQMEINRQMGESLRQMQSLMAEQEAQIEALARQVDSLQSQEKARPPVAGGQ